MKDGIIKGFGENYAALSPDGAIDLLIGGESFWSLSGDELDRVGENWLVTEFTFDSDWKSWEMHPDGEEIVYLLSGEADFILEKDGITRTFELRGKGAVVVPREAWHTAKVFKTSTMLIITRGVGTEHRPV